MQEIVLVDLTHGMHICKRIIIFDALHNVWVKIFQKHNSSEELPIFNYMFHIRKSDA